MSVHFEIPPATIIPGIASLRASCDAIASGENLSLLSGQEVRTTVAAFPGPCGMVLTLFGLDLGLLVVNTTPLGRNSFYLPGIATISFGIVDVSLDLVTALDSRTIIEDPAAAAVEPEDASWPTWGAQRLLVTAATGEGETFGTSLNTTFRYTVSLALTVYALSIVLYQVGLTTLGTYVGVPSLVTNVTVDLVPRALSLQEPTQVDHEGATFTWSAVLDSDADHLELWLADTEWNRSFRVDDVRVTQLRVPLEPDTSYEARIVVVDLAGQATASPPVSFRTAAEPGGPPPDGGGVTASGSDALVWTLGILAVAGSVVGYLLGSLRRRD